MPLEYPPPTLDDLAPVFDDEEEDDFLPLTPEPPTETPKSQSKTTKRTPNSAVRRPNFASTSAEKRKASQIDDEADTPSKQARTSDADVVSSARRTRGTGTNARARIAKETREALAAEAAERDAQNKSPSKKKAASKKATPKKKPAGKKLPGTSKTAAKAPRKSKIDYTDSRQPGESRRPASQSNAAKMLANPTGQRKKRRAKAGMAALREIKKYQKSVDLLIPKLPFSRLVREIAHEIKPDLRFEANAMACLQEAAEAYLATVFHGINLMAIHAGRVTIQKKDLEMLKQVSALNLRF